MLFKQAQDELASEITKTSADADTLGKIKRALNFGKSEVSKYSLWRHLEVPNNELLLVPQYTTGTATVVQDSRTVVISGGVVASNFQGRFFKGQKSTVQYEIISVDIPSNTLILKTPIIEDSGTYTYTIWKKFYRVPSDLRVLLPNEEYVDLPTPFEVHGYDDYAVNLSVIINLTANSNILTGSGFLDVVFPGDIIQADVNLYRVKQVQSDTKILMTNLAISDFAGTGTFSFDTPYKASLVGYPNPSIRGFAITSDPTGKTIINYSYIKTIYDMVNDSDTTELPHYFDRAILDFAKAEYGRAVNSPVWQTDLSLAQARLQKLEADKKLVWESHGQFKPLIPSGLGRGRYRGSRW